MAFSPVLVDNVLVVGDKVSTSEELFKRTDSLLWRESLTEDPRSSMDKARRFGWHGHVDSIEAMRKVFEKFAEYKMIPPLDQTVQQI